MNSNKHCIFKIGPHQVTPALRSLFDPSDPASLRCFAVLDGDTRGRIFTDRPQNPTWGVVQEAASGCLHLGGKVHYPSLRRLISRLLQHGNVLVGLWPEDQRWQLLPRAPDYSGFTLVFSNRRPDHANGDHLAIPAGCELLPMDLSLLEHSVGKSHYLSIYGSVHQVLNKGFGMCVTDHSVLLCEAFAGPSAEGYIEIVTATNANHRHKAYATLTCHNLITQMEQHGYRTYANCARDNHASIGLARKLGYQTEREYRLLTWLKRAA